MKQSLLILALIPAISAPCLATTPGSPTAVVEKGLHIAEGALESTVRAVRGAEPSLVIWDSSLSDRTVCWSDMYDMMLTKVSSEIIPGLFETETAADFWLSAGQRVRITSVRWWGGPYDPGGPEVTDFSLSLYYSNGWAPADSAFWEIHEANPSSVYIGDSVHGSPTYEYELNVDIPLSAGFNPRYWLSIQAEHPWPVPQWGRQGSSDFGSVVPYFRSEWFGNPEWEPLPDIVEYKWEASFEVECEPMVRLHHESIAGGVSKPLQVYPNPGFSPMSVSFDLAEGGFVQLSVLDVSGRLVKVLTRGERPAGRHRVVWSQDGHLGQRVPAGIYFLRLMGRNAVETHKITILE